MVNKSDGLAIQVALLAKDMKNEKEKTKRLETRSKELSDKLIRLEPVKRLVYGAVALILTAVVGGLIGLVLIR